MAEFESDTFRLRRDITSDTVKTIKLTTNSLTTNEINGELNIASSASAGSSGTLPSQVRGYLPITIEGVNYRIPLYGP